MLLEQQSNTADVSMSQLRWKYKIIYANGAFSPHFKVFFVLFSLSDLKQVKFTGQSFKKSNSVGSDSSKTFKHVHLFFIVFIF